jgi:hypothetical protein
MYKLEGCFKNWCHKYRSETVAIELDGINWVRLQVIDRKGLTSNLPYKLPPVHSALPVMTGDTAAERVVCVLVGGRGGSSRSSNVEVDQHWCLNKMALGVGSVEHMCLTWTVNSDKQQKRLAKPGRPSGLDMVHLRYQNGRSGGLDVAIWN